MKQTKSSFNDNLNNELKSIIARSTEYSGFGNYNRKKAQSEMKMKPNSSTPNLLSQSSSTELLPIEEDIQGVRVQVMGIEIKRELG